MVMPSKRSGGRHSDSDLDNVACRISSCQYKQKKTFKEEAYPVIKQHAAQASFLWNLEHQASMRVNMSNDTTPSNM